MASTPKSPISDKRPLDGFMLKSEVPSTGKDWMSINEKVEFQVAADFDHEDEKMKNTLRLLMEGDQESMPPRRRMDNSDNENPYEYSAIFVDGQETYYPAYSQAWRFIGYYVDCNPQEENDRRRMEDGGGGCLRYLLWAAYVDPNYGGNGLYEYEFYDRYNDEWVSYCADEYYNCRKMDCHEEDTEWKLMGFFKHADYQDWMEQLFKHEGVCVWTEDEYDFMKRMDDFVLEGCQLTEYADDDGAYLYYGLRPMRDGDIDIGLYKDYQCSQLYEGDIDVYDLLDDGEWGGSGSGDKYALNETVAYFNSAFSIFKICQPCVAYDLENDFECDDEAGYTNVNQCMKFSSKCERGTASFSDILLASEQKTTVNLKLMGNYLNNPYESKVTYHDTTIQLDEGKNNMRISMVAVSVCVFLWGVLVVRKKRKEIATKTDFDEPLMYQEGIYA